MELIPKTIKFSGNSLRHELQQIMSRYFSSRNISDKGNLAMWVKSFVMLLHYFVPYVLLLEIYKTESTISHWFALPLIIIMGLGYIGIGMCIMHDAAHGAYSEKKWVNYTLSLVIFFLGNNDTNWKRQHNINHHTNTNVDKFDEDLNAGGFLRLSEHSKYRKIYRYQHIYCWWIYCFYTLGRFVGEFLRIHEYKKAGLENSFTLKSSIAEYVKMIIIKIVYLYFMIIIPLQLTNFSVWEILLGFFIMHAFSGLTIAIVFQLAHIVEGAEQPLPIDGHIEMNWDEHEVLTTVNFRTNRIVSWYLGGLNYQVEHHIFPKICHIHYKDISPEFQKGVEFFEQREKKGIKYKFFPSAGSAIASHKRRMEQLGQEPTKVIILGS